MKKNILFVCLVSMSFLFFCSCEDDFSPYGEFNERYIFNCILNPDSNSQTATLSHSYYYEGLNPSDHNDDPNIAGAHVRISFLDSVQILNQDFVLRNDQTRYKEPTAIYSANDFSPKPDTEYKIEILMPDGRRLHSKTRTPAKVFFNTGKSDNIIPPPNKEYVEVFWDSPGQDLYVVPIFTIIFLKNGPNGQERRVKKVPVKYVKNEDIYVPHFPEPAYLTKIHAEVDAFSRALREISEGDPNKSNYTIYAFILEIRIYDKYLTDYFASQRDGADSFTLNVAEKDYTNIENGYGIFGSYILQETSIKFSHDYIRSFGYNPGLTE